VELNVYVDLGFCKKERANISLKRDDPLSKAIFRSMPAVVWRGDY
jgi:hypothetical protein